MPRGSTGTGKQKRTMKKAGKAYKANREIARGGMNNKASKGYAQKYGSTKYVKYKGSQVKKKKR